MQSSSSDGLPAKGGQTSTIVVQSPIVPPSSYAAGGYAHAQAPEVPNVVKSAHGTIHRGRVVPTDFAKVRIQHNFSIRYCWSDNPQRIRERTKLRSVQSWRSPSINNWLYLWSAELNWSIVRCGLFVV